MLLYYLFWMFNGLYYTLLYYFGTNLLTKGPVQIAVFWPISVFRRKGISNGMKPSQGSFWNKRNPGDLEWTPRKQWGSHEAGGRAPTLVGPSQLHRPTSSSYIYSYTLKTSRSTAKPYFHCRNLLDPRDPILGTFPALPGGGIDHGGLLHQHRSLSDDVWVVYHRPSGP